MWLGMPVCRGWNGLAKKGGNWRLISQSVCIPEVEIRTRMAGWSLGGG